MPAVAVLRGCGSRKLAGIYGECGLSENGLPVESFLMDPPVAVDPEALGLSPIGVRLVQDTRTEVWNVWDWVGAQHYPNVADFVEEVRRFGASRRMEGIDHALLTRESRLMLVHARGYVSNWQDFARDRRWPCPKLLARQSLAGRGLGDHAAARFVTVPVTHDLEAPDHGSLCCGLWWDELDRAEKVQRTGSDTVVALDGQPVRVPGYLVPPDARVVGRVMPSFRYVGRTACPDTKRLYAPALFMALPLERLVVVDDPARPDKVADKVARASAGGLPVEVTRE